MELPAVINFKVKPGRDDDIIRWLKSLGEKERSFYIRMALREWLQGKIKGNGGVRVQVHNDSKVPGPEVSEEELNKRLDGLSF